MKLRAWVKKLKCLLRHDWIETSSLHRFCPRCGRRQELVIDRSWFDDEQVVWVDILKQPNAGTHAPATKKL
jgi:hypothetical protein